MAICCVGVSGFQSSGMRKELVVVVDSFSKLTQRIFEYGKVQNTSLTLDKELNILMYCVTINGSYKLLKLVRFLAQSVLQYIVCLLYTSDAADE